MLFRKQVFFIERSDFLRVLSKKSEYEWSQAHADAFERLISVRLCIGFPYGRHKGVCSFKPCIQATMIAVRGGSVGVGRSSWRVSRARTIRDTGHGWCTLYTIQIVWHCMFVTQIVCHQADCTLYNLHVRT